MIVVMFGCHARSYVQACHVMLQNALPWLHECCMGYVLEEKAREQSIVFFEVQSIVAAGNEGQLMCAASAGHWFSRGIGSYRLQSAVVHVCECVGCFGVCGCRSQFNG